MHFISHRFRREVRLPDQRSSLGAVPVSESATFVSFFLLEDRIAHLERHIKGIQLEDCSSLLAVFVIVRLARLRKCDMCFVFSA